jgi:outer membrane protein assembly factor BamB
MEVLLTAIKRPAFRSIFLLLIIGGLFLTACGTRTENTNWPGLSTDGKNLYLANGPSVTAYDAATQELLWRFPGPDDETNPQLQFYSAPSVQENRVIFGDYGAPGGMLNPRVTVTVYALENNSPTAPVIWTADKVAFDKIVAPPLQVGDVVYVGTADNLMLALDATNGEPVWPQAFEAGHSIWGQAAYSGGILYVASMDRALHALEAETGIERWETEFDGAIASRPVLNEGLIYISELGNQIHAVDKQNGNIVWSAPAENWVWGAPAYADGVVYYADIDGNIFAVDAQSGDALWRAEAPGAVQTNPLVVDGIVYIASEGESSDVPAGALTAFDSANGEQLWRQVTPAPLFTAPVAVDEAVVVAMQSESAILSAYDLQSGAPLWNIAPQQPE